MTCAKRIRDDETVSNVTNEVHDSFWDCCDEEANEKLSNVKKRILLQVKLTII